MDRESCFKGGIVIKGLFGFINKVKLFLQEKIPGARERFIVACCTAAIVMLVSIGIFIVKNKSGNAARQAPVSGDVQRIIIPPEDLFLQKEPDFIPGVLLVRERRTMWTAEDAEQYWQDPLKHGEEPWRQQIEKVIDELMEHVP